MLIKNQIYEARITDYTTEVTGGKQTAQETPTEPVESTEGVG